MEYRIRKAMLDDADEIAHVHIESWRTTYAGIVSQDYLDTLSVEARAQNWRTHLATVDPLIAVADGVPGLLGFACGGKQRDESLAYDGEPYAIYLVKAAQGQGIGRALVRALADGLRSRNFESMIVWVLERNPAVAFYESLGGIRIAQKPIEIAGAQFIELAFAWPDLATFDFKARDAGDASA
jgi:GNAT superfamily N-acetyltransferase